ncbi:hypothetical protein C8F04DRAFT_1250161 [Mycena alexandri]|uniref:F-box domain-containing protein n=1 Tax=Mycena alexandri TaxID=1745969 RepID=A0AAD6X9K2_9AGAR|nr:hypothetical protein C8F04DRAFT_1266148 [Mycena alexandri]KAJ7044213.1 hypothetical protein C8F04DRAFT_1250161 [Mycena alexandri]
MSQSHCGLACSPPGRIFPPEVLALILPNAFGSHIQDFTTYSDNRRHVCLVCRLWRDVVYLTPSAWCCIPVSLYISQRYVEFCLNKANQSSIFVFFNLLRFASLDGTGPLQTRTPADVANIIFPLFSGAARIEELKLRASDRTSCATLTSWVSRTNSGILRRASLILEAPRDRLAESLSLQPFVGAHELAELHMGYSILPWPMEMVYENLTVLGLSHLPMRNPMGWLEVIRVLSATPKLKQLHLFRVECYHASLPESTPVLEHLETLCLTFAHLSGAEIVSYIEMPSLRQLRLDMRQEQGTVKPSVEGFVRSCHHLLRRLSVLDIGSMHATLDEVRFLFSCLEAVERLDMRRASKQLTEDVVNLIIQKALAFRKLRTLELGMPMSCDKLSSLSMALPVDAEILLPAPRSGGALQRCVWTNGVLDITEHYSPPRFPPDHEQL